MTQRPAWLFLTVGVCALAFALIGLFNSDLDSREVLLIALFGAGVAFLSLGANRLSRSRQQG